MKSQHFVSYDDIKLHRHVNLGNAISKQLELLYKASLPETEQVEWSILQGEIAINKRWLFTLERDDHLINFIITLLLPDTGIHLMEQVGWVEPTARPTTL